MSARRRPFDRFRFVLIVALLSVTALGSYWVLEVLRRSAPETVSAVHSGEPDYTIEKFVYVKMSNTGHPRYNIAGDKLTHMPQNDSYEILHPVLDSRNNPQSPLNLRSVRAVVDHGASQIHMYDTVRLDRPASASTEHFQLSSDYLLILPDEDIVQTDRQVEMMLGRTSLSGIGLVINNAARVMQMSRRAHVIFQPAAPGATR